MTDQISEEFLPVVNAIARELYAIRGYTVPQEYDFFKATHPQEKEALMGALRSLQILNEYCLDQWGSSMHDLIPCDDWEDEQTF